MNRVRPGEAPELVTSRNFDDLASLLSDAFKIIEAAVATLEKGGASPRALTGIGTANQVAYFLAGQILGGSANLTFNGALLNIIGGLTASSDISAVGNMPGTDISVRINNTSATVGSIARLYLTALLPIVRFSNGTTDFTMGIDAGGNFTISRSGALGTNDKIAMNATDITVVTNLRLGAVGNGLWIKPGANGRINLGNVLVGGTKVVANTSVTATTVFLPSVSTVGGTQGILSFVRNAGVGYTINSSNALDTSTVDVVLVEAA